ncbi:hypothetical protein K461DRAFT_275946 [Myriangium duriaei CBS 260.36]|uniref:Protein kinase domain-containing protein n=1 Tax=Myriangium duriaei CBS 260.36 TaxID=1168546 RepID=A0A9P4J558_9PEZI|nr:hypothetical protein K461DRAFT_275946 [Myriangium duriaei CBS 260.36]
MEDEVISSPNYLNDIRHLWPDGTVIPAEDVLSARRWTVLALHPDFPNLLLKGPRQDVQEGADEGWSNKDRLLMHKQEHDDEVAAYQRLARVKGVVGYHGIRLGRFIAMDYHPHGSLDHIMYESLYDGERAPSLQVRLKWMIDAVHIVVACHEARVLLFDIALRNFVVTSADISLRAIDFVDSEILPIDAEIEKVNVRGRTVQVDLIYLGCVLYSLATWSLYQINVQVKHDLESFPEVKGVPWGPLIQGCWQDRSVKTSQLAKLCDSRRSRRRFVRRSKSEKHGRGSKQ